MNDIRLCPYTIEAVEGHELARVYHFNGFQCWLSEVSEHYPHASVYLYSVKHPNGYIQQDVDIAEVNKIIFQ